MQKQYNSPDCREPQIGDWVRFYRYGKLEMGVVNYISTVSKAWDTTDVELCTDNGCILITAVIEMRR